MVEAKRRIIKPAIGRAIINVRFGMLVEAEAEDAGDVSDVDAGSKVELKILDGRIAKAAPVAVTKWQL
jgi:hypothetical protein